ncbi:hypothetical protein SAMN04489712_114161 [Thermomonospora echinospora]|uniref:Uncharacterized protein n=1 Tax=Thermomonospora echinospora TaxID=1992 RepID=A0A1H6D9V1_9ACTN|nr:NAD(P)H-binding protein [Thermomonospora echinospora]SEG81864.1 hypothetical protein SAMN04489712_114161 [Thermomonospora echinospora]
MTILVTGATGKVGHNVLTELLAAGRAVRAIFRPSEQAGLPEEVEVLHAEALNIGYAPVAQRGVPALEPSRLAHVSCAYLSAETFSPDPAWMDGSAVRDRAAVTRARARPGCGCR